MNKGNFIIQIVVVLLLVTINYSCSNDKLPATCSGDPECICFETDILPIVISNCTESTCHNSNDLADNYDFTNYDGIMAAVNPFNKNGSDFYESITETNLNDIMPPPPNTPLNTDQINLIGKWIDQGAPNTVNCVACDSVANVSFSMEVLPILTASCISCHSGTTPDAGIDQASWATVKATVDAGSFLGSIKHDASYEPMPLNGQLDFCSIKIIETWVAEGAENN